MLSFGLYLIPMSIQAKRCVGEKVVAPEVQQGKQVVNYGKNREKLLSSQQCAPERVVVENNLLGKALVEGCAIAALCRTKVAEQLLEIVVKAGRGGESSPRKCDGKTERRLC